MQAFTRAVALQLFTLRHGSASASLASAAGAASSGLAAAAGVLAGYVRQFLAVARTAASAAESHTLLQRCQATLDTAAAQEQQLLGQEQHGRTALAALLADAQPVAAQVLAALQECQVSAAAAGRLKALSPCAAAPAGNWADSPLLTYRPLACPHSTPLAVQAWQQRHNALLPLLLSSPPAALLLGAAAWDPDAAATAGALPPLLLVSSPAGVGGESGAGSILHAALGMLPGQAPLSASLLLQAAAADSQGQQLLRERAAAAGQLAAALREFGAAAACLLGGPRYAGTSQHAHWLAALQAALELPVPQVRYLWSGLKQPGWACS